MASKKIPFPGGRQSPKGEQEKTNADYYRLNTKAVDDLVNANAENSPPVSQKELRKYHAQKKPLLADWVKAVLLKAWLAGIVCYFILWGLGPYALNQMDMLLVVGVALGFVTAGWEYGAGGGADSVWMLHHGLGYASDRLQKIGEKHRKGRSKKRRR